uniref:RNA-dependent RNA polymerase n=1 Tax=Picornavirales sp. TaxID=1955153 RepID=A0A514DCP6_9VIRU|nr:MAG: RNA-dependent RNA polymerase [Picornavirales sp.]
MYYSNPPPNKNTTQPTPSAEVSSDRPVTAWQAPSTFARPGPSSVNPEIWTRSRVFSSSSEESNFSTQETVAPDEIAPQINVEDVLLDISRIPVPTTPDERRFFLNTLDKFADYDWDAVCASCLLYRNSNLCLHGSMVPFSRFSSTALSRVISGKSLRELACRFIYNNSISLGKNSRTTLRVFAFMKRSLRKDVQKKVNMYYNSLKRHPHDNFRAVPQSGFTMFNVGIDDNSKEYFDDVLSQFRKVSKDLGSMAPGPDVANRLLSSVEKIGDAANGFANSSVLNNLSEFMAYFNTKTSDTSKVKRVSMDKKAIFSFCSLLACTILYIRDPKRVNLVGVLVSFVATLAFTDFYAMGSFYSSITGLIEYIASISQRVDDAIPEAGFEDGVNFFNLAFASVYSSYSGKDIPMEFMKTLNVVGRAKGTLTEILRSVIKAIEEMTNYVLLHYTDSHPVRFLKANVQEIDDFLQKSNVIFAMYNRNEFPYTLERKYFLDSVILEGKKLFAGFPRDRNIDNAIKLLFDEIQKLIKIQKEFTTETSSMKGAKQEAVIVMFRGGPGTGKSLTLEKFSQDFVREILDPSEIATFEANYATYIYARMGVQGFWDGATPLMKAVLYDDFMQSRDYLGTDNPEVIELIRGGSSFPFALHMASLEEKGKVHMNAELIACTTNLSSMNFETISKPEALFRRISFDYIVHPHPDFVLESTKDLSLWEQKFDISKLPRSNYVDTDGSPRDVSNMHPHAQLFTPCDKDGVPLSDARTLTYDEVLQKALDLRKLKRAWYLRSLREFRNPTTRKQFFASTDKSTPTLPEGGSSSSDEAGSSTPNPEKDGGIEFRVPSLPSIPRSDSEPILEILSSEEDCFLEGIPPREDPFEFDRRPIWDWQMMYRPEVVIYAEKFLFRFWEGTREFDILVNRTMDLAMVTFEIETLNGVAFSPYLMCAVLEVHGALAVEYLRFGNVAVIRSEVFSHKQPYCVPRFPIPINPDVKSWRKIAKDSIMKLLKVIDTTFCDFIEWFEKCDYSWLILFSVMAGFAFVFLYPHLRSLIDSIFGKEESEPESLGHSDKLAKSRAPKKWVRNADQVKHDLKIVPEAGGGLDSSGYELGLSIFNRAFYLLQVETKLGSGNFDTLGSIFFVSGRIALMPYHFVLRILSYVEDNPELLDCDVKLCRNLEEDGFRYVVKVRDIIQGHQTGVLCAKDLVLVEFPRSVQVHADRTEFIAQRSDYQRVTNNIPFVMHVKGKPVRSRPGFATAIDKMVITPSYADSYTVRDMYAYPVFTGPGDCGSPFCILNTKTRNRKIFGIHIAASSKLQQGYAAALCQEDVLEDLKMFAPQIKSDDPELILPQCSDLPFPSQFGGIGYVEKYASMANYSKIVRSRLYNTIVEPISAPARLKPFTNKVGDLIDPLLIAQDNYCTRAVSFDNEVVEDARDSLRIYLYDKSKKDVHKVPWNWDEVLYGLDYDEDARGMPTTTSPGYPQNVPGVINWKEQIFRHERGSPENIEACSIVFPMLDAVEKRYRDGERPLWLFCDNLKDERRPIEKVREGKTRMFSGTPFFYYCIFKKYFGAFQLWLIKNRISNGMVIGLNPYSVEWEFLAQSLTRYDFTGSAVGAGDYSKFDGSEQPKIHYAILDIINDWYDDGADNALIRSILWLEVVNSRHLCEGVVVEWPSALPSGHPFTMPINCLYNHMNFRMSWKLLRLPMYHFNAHVYLAVCGDDNIFTVSHEYRDLFNEMTLVSVMSELGMTYTTELKGTATIPFRKLEEVEFLKRSFRFEPILGRRVGPLRLSVILEMVNWSKKGADFVDITCHNVDVALDELSLHPRDVYSLWRARIVNSFLIQYPGSITQRSMYDKYPDRQAFVVDSDVFFSG